jgi:hypothetical protein
VLQLSNRLILAGSAEVVVNLATAKAALGGTTPAVSTASVTSTLKATTGTTALMPYVAGLDTLNATINLALAQRLTATEIAALSIFSSSYAYFDSANKAALAAKLEGYGSNGYQITRWQILDCLDDPIPSKGCTKIKVASLVRDSAGNVVDVFDNVVTYATATGWTLLGNNRQTPWYLYPITWAQWDSTGALNTAVSHNPGQGMQVVIGSTAFMQATLQLPNGFSLTFYYCQLTTLCQTATLVAGSLSGVDTGDLITDQVLQSTMVGWIGTTDAKPGAKYQIQTVTLNAGSESNSTILTTDMPLTSPQTAYPKPDGLSSSAPLQIANFTAGLPVAWSTWAAANPQLRMIEVRGVITSTASTPVVQSVKVLPLSSKQLTLPAFTSIPSDATTYTLWLIAQDDAGRRYVSKIVAAP